MTNDGEKRTQKNDATFQWLTHQCLSSDDINMRLYFIPSPVKLNADKNLYFLEKIHSINILCALSRLAHKSV